MITKKFSSNGNIHFIFLFSLMLTSPIYFWFTHKFSIPFLFFIFSAFLINAFVGHWFYDFFDRKNTSLAWVQSFLTPFLLLLLCIAAPTPTNSDLHYAEMLIPYTIVVIFSVQLSLFFLKNFKKIN